MSSKAKPKQEEQDIIASSGLSPEEVEELREAFNLFDTNSTGMIDAGELKAAMESLGYNQNRFAVEMLEVRCVFVNLADGRSMC